MHPTTKPSCEKGILPILSSKAQLQVVSIAPNERLGTCASIPIVLCSLFTVFQTRQGDHVNMSWNMSRNMSLRGTVRLRERERERAIFREQIPEENTGLPFQQRLSQEGQACAGAGATRCHSAQCPACMGQLSASHFTM